MLACVIGERKGQIVRICLSHDRIGPVVELFANILSGHVGRIDKGKELGHDLGGGVDTVVAKLLNRGRAHARNFCHPEIK